MRAANETVWSGRGLVTHYLLFVISLADRVVQVLGVTAKPDEAWILQIGRNLIDTESGALCGKPYLIIDRDTVSTRTNFCDWCASTVADGLRASMSRRLRADNPVFVRMNGNFPLD